MEPPLRLTRRGRATVLVGLAGVASLCSAVLFATASRAAGDAPGAAPLPTVVVQPGDTLWGIAGRGYPGVDRQVAVAELRRLNGMGGYDVRPGDVLVLPRER